jgi:hypothetical protein
MHRSEALEFEVCASCAAEVAPEQRTYAFDESVLCYECGLARGGSYDEVHDRWTRAPDVSDLSHTEVV